MLLWSHRARAARKRGDAEQCSRSHGQHVRVHSWMPPTMLWKALKIRRKPNISREGRGKKIGKGLGSCSLPSLPSPPKPLAIHAAAKCSHFRGYQRILILQSENGWIQLPNIALAQKVSERCTLSHTEPDIGCHFSVILRRVKSTAFPPRAGLMVWLRAT